MKDSQESVGCKHFGFRTVAVISLALALCGVVKAQNPVIDWNAIAVTAALNANQTMSPGSNASGGMSLYLAYTHLAIYDAINAIDHRFQSYGPEIPAPPGASTDAAVISAAYNTLFFYLPDQSAFLTAQYTAALGLIPDGQAKDDGIQVGKAAANSIIASRAGGGTRSQHLRHRPSVCHVVDCRRRLLHRLLGRKIPLWFLATSNGYSERRNRRESGHGS